MSATETKSTSVKFNSPTAIDPREIKIVEDRNFSRFDESENETEDDRKLAYSMFTNGQDTAVHVRKAGGEIELVAGYRRRRAAMLILNGFDYTHPVTNEIVRVYNPNFRLKVVSSVLSDEEVFRKNARENLDRKDLSPVDKAVLCQRGINVMNMKHAELAELLGCTVPQIYNFLALASLPRDIQVKVHSGELAMTVAVDGSKIPIEKFREKLGEAQSKGTTVKINDMKDALREHKTETGKGGNVSRNVKEIRKTVQEFTGNAEPTPIRKFAESTVEFINGNKTPVQFENSLKRVCTDSGKVVLEYLKEMYEGRIPDGVKFDTIVKQALEYEVERRQETV